jgi:hypothetical protein
MILKSKDDIAPLIKAIDALLACDLTEKQRKEIETVATSR